MKKNLTPKEIFKEMHHAARLWYSAQEIDLNAPIMVNTLPGGYSFMAWYYWDNLVLYRTYVWPDGRIKFGITDLRPDIFIAKEIRVA